MQPEKELFQNPAFACVSSDNGVLKAIALLAIAGSTL